MILSISIPSHTSPVNLLSSIDLESAFLTDSLFINSRNVFPSGVSPCFS
ncbi:hypothetical protein OMAG_000824 [Candidatus Omnitrophus magneticus]|uniref:Uncharacterized protein n=1 Tax=Candidatus Omnitrophus magneticus TaxID=1609969 RepID=A0A0F0CSP6_9BACT|nr:hypothetical protein OMAG_001963 [Candidatus Omnitrophus magneticus]KJJ84421.1 hypothetical protein OMAG_001712 [Candidatus Omnitrophus magneticus]KJJ84475.1 hypothetical protein OMAG_001660 [Candidatus Omnitrophus magneticus]KJJ85285.1 hypothetical protein OMAG_000850 [Candidatus Omnitrophus magneticus]KJJ85309.1 hypothetical protein OMAG_000824 [Candidatus Omnitrophus magneticus]